MFFEIWKEFDPHGTMYMSFDHVSDLLDCLDRPLQVHVTVVFVITNYLVNESFKVYSECCVKKKYIKNLF